MRIVSRLEGCGSLIGKNIQCLISLPMDVIPPEGFLLSKHFQQKCEAVLRRIMRKDK